MTTNGSGNAAFAAILSRGVPAGYVATAMPTDPNGSTSEFSACFTFTSCTPVHGVDFSWDRSTPLVGQAITFSSSTSGALPITLTWDLGDGTLGRGANIAHTYAATGTYIVEMTATNPCGQRMVWSNLTVVACKIFLPVVYKDW